LCVCLCRRINVYVRKYVMPSLPCNQLHLHQIRYKRLARCYVKRLWNRRSLRLTMVCTVRFRCAVVQCNYTQWRLTSEWRTLECRCQCEGPCEWEWGGWGLFLWVYMVMSVYTQSSDWGWHVQLNNETLADHHFNKLCHQSSLFYLRRHWISSTRRTELDRIILNPLKPTVAIVRVPGCQKLQMTA